MQTFEAWQRRTRQRRRRAQLQPFYAKPRRSAPAAIAADRRLRPASSAAIDIDGVSVVWWKDDREVVVVTYTETAAERAAPRQKRQYWLQNAGQWKVIFEGNLA